LLEALQQVLEYDGSLIEAKQQGERADQLLLLQFKYQTDFI
jgi:hypothetical protein